MKGFTILESILSVLLLTLAVLAIFQVFGTASLIDSGLNAQATALYLCEEKLEEIAGAAYADIDGFASTRKSVGGDFSSFEREVLVSGDTLKQIHVLVYWQEKNAERQEDLLTLRADY